MIAIVHSIYSQSVHAPALNAGLMDNDAERYCTMTGCLRLFRKLVIQSKILLAMPCSALISRINLHGLPCRKLSKSLGRQRQFGI